jgi:peptidyl-prolyl cis-trans isomerase C
MIKRFALGLVLSVGTIAASLAAGNTVVAKVTADGKTTEITNDQIDDHVKMLPPQLQNAPREKIFEIVRDRIIKMQLAASEARKKGLDKDAAVQRRVDIGKEVLLAEALFATKKPSEDELKKAYNELKGMAAKEKEVRIKMIVVASKSDAEAAKAEIKGGKSFDDVAKAKSLDDQTKDKGGDMGYRPSKAFPPEIAEKVALAKNAVLIDEPIKFSLGEGKDLWALVRKEDERPMEVPKYDEVKGELEFLMVGPKKRKEYEAELMKTATVELFDKDGKPESKKPDDAAKADDKKSDASAKADDKKPEEKK